MSVEPYPEDTPAPRRGGGPGRVAVVMLVAGLAAVAVTLPWPGQDIDAVPLVLVLAAAAVLAWSVRLHALQRLWDVAGIPVFTTLIALVVAFTGGVDSNYQDLFLFVPVSTALLRPLRSVVAAVLASLAGAVAPALYESASAMFFADAVADTAVWAVAAAVVYVQTRDLRRQQARLEEATAVKSAFLRAISHELRTPLTVIRGSTQLLREQADRLTRTQRRQIESRLDTNARRLERLVTDLLDVDRLLRGTIEAAADPVDLAEVAADMVEQADRDDRPVTLEAAPTVVAGDRPKLERIVDALVGNALRHTPPGTPVRIWVTPHEDHGVLVVEDEGPGLPDELRGRVFEVFEQGEQAATAARPGTGVGLALVDRLVRLHGGTVDAEDRHGGGARLVVRLPLHDQHPGAGA